MLTAPTKQLAGLALIAALAAGGCGSSEQADSERATTTAAEQAAKPTKTTAGEKRVVVMPDLLGTGVYEAQCKLVALGLGWSADGRDPTMEPEAPCGTLDTAAPVPNPPIQAQKPKPGTKLLSGGVIGLATSCANQRAPKDGPYCLSGQPGSP